MRCQFVMVLHCTIIIGQEMMLKILLVEDNLSFRGSLKSALLNRIADLEIKEAADDKSTMVIVEAYLPDLIIMDINLNCAISGLDLTKLITTMYSEIAVVILSHHDVPEYRSVAMENGAHSFFSKSSPLENIIDYVDSVALSECGLH